MLIDVGVPPVYVCKDAKLEIIRSLTYLYVIRVCASLSGLFEEIHDIYSSKIDYKKENKIQMPIPS